MYFNENDPFAAQWLRELFPQSVVDDRSIEVVRASDITDSRCHFFGGIGGWEYALQLAGWPSGQQVWTASCPCQPFSNAGKRKGESDKRHLWPVLRSLIAYVRPQCVFGEQVASKAGREWLTRVRAEMEGLGYEFGAADLCAPGVQSPHIRQRLYWVAYSGRSAGECGARGFSSQEAGERGPRQFDGNLSVRPANGCEDSADGLADYENCGRIEECSITGGLREGIRAEGNWRRLTDDCESIRLGEPSREGLQIGVSEPGIQRTARQPSPRQTSELSGNHNPWSSFDIVYCRDGKARRIESSTFPLVDGVSKQLGHRGSEGPPITEEYAKATAEGRQGRLRGYGNAIVPQLAAEFISAFMECV